VEDGFQVAVKNYGIGVEEDEAEHVFRPNYRSPAAIRRKVGNGLGLTISRAAMRRHGGDLQLSRLKDPTILTMCFPKQLRYQKIDRS
jgi:signal transduction histidine kinase